MSLRSFFADMMDKPLGMWSWAQRAAYSLANDRSFKNRLRWHRSHYNATMQVQMDREAARKLGWLGMPDAARVAREDAHERSMATVELGAVLVHAPLPEPLSHYKNEPE